MLVSDTVLLIFYLCINLLFVLLLEFEGKKRGSLKCRTFKHIKSRDHVFINRMK